MWVQGHQNYDALCKHGRKNNCILIQSSLSHVTCLCALWRYKAERDYPAADALVWCSIKMIAVYTMCILRELATAILIQVTSVRLWYWSNTVQNVYGTVSLHGVILKITENRVMVNVYLQELCYILLVMNLWDITVKWTVYVGSLYLYGGPTSVTETVRLIVLLLYSYDVAHATWHFSSCHSQRQQHLLTALQMFYWTHPFMQHLALQPPSGPLLMASTPLPGPSQWSSQH